MRYATQAKRVFSVETSPKPNDVQGAIAASRILPREAPETVINPWKKAAVPFRSQLFVRDIFLWNQTRGRPVRAPTAGSPGYSCDCWCWIPGTGRPHGPQCRWPGRK